MTIATAHVTRYVTIIYAAGGNNYAKARVSRRYNFASVAWHKGALEANSIIAVIKNLYVDIKILSL